MSINTGNSIATNKMKLIITANEPNLICAGRFLNAKIAAKSEADIMATAMVKGIKEVIPIDSPPTLIHVGRNNMATMPPIANKYQTDCIL